MGGYDEEAGEQIGGNAMSGNDVTSTADGGVAAVGGENDNGGDCRF